MATIIVSDHDQAICELYADLFADAGYTTKVVTPQKTSAASIGAAGADIVLLEVMPGTPLAALRLVVQLRACPATAHLPVVLLSTLPSFVDQLSQALKGLGCTAVVKPFQVDELLSHVGEVLAARAPQPTAVCALV